MRSIICCVLLGCALLLIAAPPQTFTLKEAFGVAHPDQVVDFDVTAPVEAKASFLVGPNGAEAPYQLLEGGKKLAVRTHLPASRFPVPVYGGLSPTRWKLPGMENYLSVDHPLAVGDPVRLSGPIVPEGLKAGTDYYVAAVKRTDAGWFAAFAATLGGPVAPIVREAPGMTLTLLAFTVDCDANRLYAPGHGLHDGDPVTFRSTGALPAPLTADAVYRVRNADVTSFQLAAEDPQSAALITLKTAGEGLHSLRIVWTWQLLTGHAPKPAADGINTVKTATYYEITNGLTGIRVPLPTANPAKTPAPVQGLRYRDGVWTATGPNYLNPPAKGMTVTFRESGPLKTVVEVSYAYDRAAVTHKGPWDPPDGAVYPAGEGHYTVTITVEAGQPSLLFEEDADVDVSYSLNIYNGLHPTQARYQGHHANSKEMGYESDGQQYRMSHARSNLDAFVDFKYDAPRAYRPLSVWDPWAYDTGWYWQAYDQNAPATGNLFGIFAGRASRAIGCAGSGVNLFTDPTGSSDYTSVVDAQGNMHTLELVNGAAWYSRFDTRLALVTRAQVTTGLSSADLLVDAQGKPHIAGYDAASGRYVLAEVRADGEFLEPIPFADDAKLKITDPYIYQAISGGTHFLLFQGEYDGKASALLYARGAGEKAFSFQQAFSMDSGRQVARPTFATLPDGTVELLFTKGQYAEVATIKPGAKSFGETVNAQRLFGDVKTRFLNFGSALDPRTDAFFVANSDGALCYFTPAGLLGVTKIGFGLEHTAQGPNRRTLAVDDAGGALATHSGVVYRYANGGWAPYAPANDLHLVAPRVHYLPATKQYLLIGRRDNALALYTFAPDGAQAPARQMDAADPRMAGLTMTIFRGVNQPRFFPRVRYQWGLFIGTKADIKAPEEPQNVCRQMNLHGGFNLSKLGRYQLDFPDPPQGYGAMYMDKAVLQRMVAKVRADKSGPNGGGYYQYLMQADPLLRDIVTMWADSTPVSTQAAADGIAATARGLLENMINGQGIFSTTYHYWHGGLEMMRKGMWIDQVLGSDLATAENREQVKAAAALFGYLLWDDDFVPMHWEVNGLNAGTENMPVQQNGYRTFYALLLANHPDMQAHAREAEQQTLDVLHAVVNEAGSNISCTHYMGASMEGLLMNALQFRMLGRDHFADEARLGKFAEFFLNLQTPPEARFGTTRKLVSFGDSPTEGSEMLGLLGTGFHTANPELSARVMGAWQAQGKPHSFFFGSTLLMIDEDAPGKDPALCSATFPGYYSVLRNGWGTPEETAIWLLNGSWYRDHYHNDLGALVIYALGAPLSLDWGSQGDPRTPSPYYHSLVIPEALIGQPWQAENPNLETGIRWGEPMVNRFLAFGQSALVSTTYTHHAFDGAWTREIVSLHPNPRYPVILIRDRFAGAQATASKVFTLNLMAEGPVQTPAGPITPMPRSWKAKELPSSSPIFALPAGVNRFTFNGQQFGTAEKPAPAVDVDLYSIADEPQEGVLGNWAHNWCAGQNNQFRAVNGRDFEERQHILRLRGQQGFTVLLLPYRKGQPRDTRVTREGANLRLIAGEEITLIGETFTACSAPDRALLTAYTADPAVGAGLTVRGGPTEIVIAGGTATITVAGDAGTRLITLPGKWKARDPKAPAKLVGGVWQVAFDGGAGIAVVLDKQKAQSD